MSTPARLTTLDDHHVAGKTRHDPSLYRRSDTDEHDGYCGRCVLGRLRRMRPDGKEHVDVKTDKVGRQSREAVQPPQRAKRAADGCNRKFDPCTDVTGAAEYEPAQVRSR